MSSKHQLCEFFLNKKINEKIKYHKTLKASQQIRIEKQKIKGKAIL